LLAFATHSGSDPSRLLSAVPETAFALVYCADPGALRERAKRNDWVGLLGSDEGEPLYVDLEESLSPLLGGTMRAPLDVGLELRGESVFFVAEEVSGLLTAPPASRDELLKSMHAWLTERSGGTDLKTVDALGGRVEIFSPAPETGSRLAALLDHPRALGLFTADSQEALLRALQDSLASLERGEERALARGLEAARATHGALAIEFYVDFSPFVAQAEAELASAGKDLGVDPTGLLGLEKGTSLYLTADMDAGDKVEVRGSLAIPPETLAASLADTFVPLPGTLAAQLPKSTWGAIALGWDYMAMIDRAREAFDKAGQNKVGETLDQSLEAANAASGINVEEQVLRQLTGTFLFFMGPPAAAEQDPPFSLGFEASIADANEFESALEALVGMALGEDATDLVQVEGQDAYVTDEVGLAILPKNVLVCLGQPFFADAIRALKGEVHASMADGTRLEAAIAENQGSSLFLCFELTPFRDVFFGELAAAGEAPPTETPAAASKAPNPFDCQLTASARRTKTGFDLRVLTR
jgi:hypothetical protein